MTTKYRVSVPEIHLQEVLVEADSPESAKMMVREGLGEYTDSLTYSETLDPREWRVREDPPTGETP